MISPIRIAELTKVSKPEIKLLTDHGHHPHQVKGPNTRKTYKDNSGKVMPWDLYRDRNQDVYVWNGHQAAEPEVTGINIEELCKAPLPARRRK